MDQRVVVNLLPEVEMGGQRVLGEVYDEVADEYVEVDVGALLEALGHHPEERHGQHEAGAQGEEVLEERPIPVSAPGHQEAAHDVGQPGDHAQGERQLTRGHAVDPPAPFCKYVAIQPDELSRETFLAAPCPLR
jgi:hypothetical protein